MADTIPPFVVLIGLYKVKVALSTSAKSLAVASCPKFESEDLQPEKPSRWSLGLTENENFSVCKLLFLYTLYFFEVLQVY